MNFHPVKSLSDIMALQFGHSVMCFMSGVGQANKMSGVGQANKCIQWTAKSVGFLCMSQAPCYTKKPPLSAATDAGVMFSKSGS